MIDGRGDGRVVKALAYQSEGCGFESWSGHQNFQIPNFAGIEGGGVVLILPEMGGYRDRCPVGLGAWECPPN